MNTNRRGFFKRLAGVAVGAAVLPNVALVKTAAAAAPGPVKFVKFRRYPPLALSTSPLVKGIVPSLADFQRTVSIPASALGFRDDDNPNGAPVGRWNPMHDADVARMIQDLRSQIANSR